MDRELCLSEIAEEMNDSLPSIRYMVIKHRIPSCRRIGHTKLYDAAAQKLIKDYMANIRIQK